MIASELNIFQKKLKNSYATKILWENIYAMQTNDLILCAYFCIGFINIMLKVKIFIECTNLFSPKNMIRMIKKY